MIILLIKIYALVESYHCFHSITTLMYWSGWLEQVNCELFVVVLLRFKTAIFIHDWQKTFCDHENRNSLVKTLYSRVYSIDSSTSFFCDNELDGETNGNQNRVLCFWFLFDRKTWEWLPMFLCVMVVQWLFTVFLYT